MLKALKHLFSPAEFKAEAHAAYVQLVAQSRKPFFYQAYRVPDTVDGRFDVMALHLFMVIHRLRGEVAPETGEFIRVLSEVFFADMDRSLREMGVGDTGVSHRIKKMAQAFYGRLQVYEQSLLKHDMLTESLKRNLYRGSDVDQETLKQVADYIDRNLTHLVQQNVDDILRGSVNFLDISA